MLAWLFEGNFCDGSDSAIKRKWKWKAIKQISLDSSCSDVCNVFNYKESEKGQKLTHSTLENIVFFSSNDLV